MTVEYTHLNLPKKMTFTPGGANNTIELLYDAAGNKLRKTIKYGTTTIYTQDYIAGIEYRSGVREAIYHPEGRIFYTSPTTTRYEYSITDHLGNTRLTFTDKNGNGKIDVLTTSSNEVLQENHYYPFGLNTEQSWMNDAAIDNRYQYNGKELNVDLGLGWNDYGARWYDAAVGRWSSVDPLSDDAPDWTTYRYGFNNPLIYIDPDGLFESRNAAKEHRQKYDTQGRIRKNKDTGRFEIHIRGSSGGRITTDEGGNVEGYVIAPTTGNATEHKDFEWFLGSVNYYFNGGNFDGQHYNKEGYNDGPSPLMGSPAVGPVRVLKSVKLLNELPTLDKTGKVHGILPKIKDLAKYSKDELTLLVKDLAKSVQQRIKVTSKMGSDRGHARRQAAEQDLIKSIEKHLGSRK